MQRCKKKYEQYSDTTGGNTAFYATAYCLWFYGIFRRRLYYIEHFGFWLNKERASNRAAGAVAKGVAVALGFVKPSLEYFRSQADGESEAIMMQGIYNARREE